MLGNADVSANEMKRSRGRKGVVCYRYRRSGKVSSLEDYGMICPNAGHLLYIGLHASEPVYAIIWE
jgi:hypothetical protein